MVAGLAFAFSSSRTKEPLWPWCDHGGIQVSTNCMNPRSRYARGLHVRPCRGALRCNALPPSDRVNFAQEGSSPRRRRVCNKRTYAPMVGMVACIILYVFVNVLILYRWYEDGFLRWYEDGFASTSIAHHSMACFTLARTAGVGVKQFKETDAQPNGVARTYVADTAG